MSRYTLRKYTSWLMALLLALGLLLPLAPTAQAAEGTCGDNLSWQLADDTLTITGSGDMYDFTESSMAPWYAYRESITRVELPSGLTRVGNLAFYGCSALKSVFLPDSVTSVGTHAFQGCSTMTVLSLGNSLAVIEKAAFRECSSLLAVRFPDSLQRLDFQAFYRCESLTSVTIPSSVTEMGATTFAYCYNLIRAEVWANISKLPDWTFYGCEKLADVSLSSTMSHSGEYAFYGCENLLNLEYNGSQRNNIVADINSDLQSSSCDTYFSTSDNSGSTSNSVFEEDGENVIATTTTTTETENAFVSSETTVIYPNADTDGSTSSADVDVTIENAEGWSEIQDTLTEIIEKNDETSINIYMKDDSTIPEEVTESLGSSNVTVTVHNPSGSIWTVDSTSANANLSYQRTPATEEQSEKLGGAPAYQIEFENDSQVNAEVIIQLPTEYAYQNAVIYQSKGSDLERLQAAVIDSDGYAHFFLASVDSDIQYIVGINVPGESTDDAIIPQNLYDQYAITDTLNEVEYVVTGRSSSWGISFGQVTGIMVILLVIVVVIVGVVMYVQSKRKQQLEYLEELRNEHK